jgi:hypothetical protein
MLSTLLYFTYAAIALTAAINLQQSIFASRLQVRGECAVVPTRQLMFNAVNPLMN